MIDIKLKNIGYDEFFDLHWQSLEIPNSLVGRVISEYKATYKVKNASGEYLAKVTGKQMFRATKREDYPAVGDWVAITIHDKGQATICSILPRKTMLKKKYSDKYDMQIIATNIDVVFIVESLDRDYNLNRFERYFILAKEGGIKPVIILNKIDLVLESELIHRIDQIKNRFNDIDIIATSTMPTQKLTDLMNYLIVGKTYCFIGSSGVGKSSLINKLLGNNIIKTREINNSSCRGKHTTTTREMYFLKNGVVVIDNPGIREVGIGKAKPSIEDVFDDIVLLSKECGYSDCSHMHEPNCAVLKAIKDGKLDKFKYENYIKLKKENEFHEMTHVEKRKKDRNFGKFIKNIKDDIKN